MFSELIEQEANSGGAVGLPVSTDDVQLSPALSPFGESLSIKLSTLETLIDGKLSKGGPASDVSFTPYGATEATTVQSALEELTLEKASVFDIAALNSAVNGKMPLDGPANRVAFTPSGGLASTNVQDAIAELDTELSFQFPAGSTSIGTGTFFDIGGLPSYATEAIFHLSGISSNATAGIVTQLLDGSGNPITAGYLGTTTGFTSAAAATAWANGSQSNVTLVTTSTAASSLTGFVRIFKAHAGYWGIESYIADPSTRSQYTIAYVPATSVSGIRCTLSGGNFDAGTQRSVWRR